MHANGESAVRCSAWVGEWEAALAHVEKAVMETPLNTLDSRAWDKASIAMRVLGEIVDAARGHSPTDPR